MVVRVTAAEARAILGEIRSGKQLRVLNMDGEWGIRALASGALVRWSTPAGESSYGPPGEWTATEDEALAMLAVHDPVGMRARLF